MMAKIGKYTVLLILTAAWPAWATPPNILLLVAEDLSPRIGAYGDSVARTPNIDGLAKRGTLYTQAFTTAGVCAPSRASLITGLHQIAFGAQHMRSSTGPLGEYFAQPPAEVRAFPELLRAAGYFTFTDGKLDYQFSGIAAGSGPFTIWDREGAADDAYRERASGQPFFGLINFAETHESGVMRPDGEPHSPAHGFTQRARKARGLVAAAVTDPADVDLPPYYPDLPAVRRDIARHYDNIHAMDQRVGRILADLEEDGLLENTIIVWTTDHGDGLPRAKRELYDSGIHVPLIVVRSGQTPTTDQRLVSFVDLAPTILRWAGLTPPAYLHGQAFDAGPAREYIYAARDRIDEVTDRQRAVRDNRYKYVRSWHPDVAGGHPLAYRDNLDMVRAWRAARAKGTLPPAQSQWFLPLGRERLYDLEKDPHELHNLADSKTHQAELTRLSQALDAHLERVGDTGEVAETELRARLLVQGKVPTTPAPKIAVVGGQVQATSPIGASIGFRQPDAPHWQLYVGPLPSQPLEFRSVRYGWLASPVVRHEP